MSAHSHSIMGGGGIETSIATRRPLAEEQTNRRMDAKIKHVNAVREASELVEELKSGSPGFRAIINAMRQRIAQLAADDVILQTLESVLADYRFKLELLPRLAEENIRRMAGPHLSEFIEGPQAAP